MLLHLRVQNFGIIEDFDWLPGAGFNVLTGETGAGKSLVIDAVSALLSGRLDETSVRHGADEIRLEGIFDLSARTDLIEYLIHKGIDCRNDPLIITLNLKRSGRAVIRLNGDSVPRTLIVELGRQLIDIHGQSQHLSLLDRTSHLDFLDAYAGTTGARQEFSQLSLKMNQIQKSIADFAHTAAERSRQTDYLKFQVQEIDRATLCPGEDKELEQEAIVLTSAEKLKALVFETLQALDDEDSQGETSAVSRLSQALSGLEKLSGIDHSISAQAQSLREALYTVTETARDLNSYASGLDFDPARLEIVESRLHLIRELKRKYGGSISDILEFARKTSNELSDLDSSGERIESLRRNADQVQQLLAEKALQLSTQRKLGAAELTKAINQELVDLAMEMVKFEINLGYVEAPDGLPLPDGRQVAYSNNGADKVEFLAATNPGEPAKALERIASTGELSRFTLAVKTALAKADRIPVLIFDEIDIGVGGRSGDIIGRKLATLALTHQVICVTHLPQIAAYAAHHYCVNKTVSNGHTSSRLDELNTVTRIRELALMLSGDSVSASSQAGALELLERAAQFIAEQKGSSI
ncbi:MAG: DNA repair protein RecN [Dehalogenimonas sp.]|uniref:DNA repair protein RecN n=1 Tax=Candidatus Dehalogenimonas loeffleri TaxID=3127115 RepID=A0ABZ2J2F8_9CHLR|nr:DNA repair protein RecN [Dehalogenimonas sp.]